MNTSIEEWLAKDDVQLKLQPVRTMQGVLTELLEIIDFICQKYNLKYYLYYGTLLGAIRHRGFIPWDDDADIAMPRKDYETLIELLTTTDELPGSYFLQCDKTEQNYRHPFAKLRKNRTACIIKEHVHIQMHQGIFIDIFPLDELSSNQLKAWALWNLPHWCDRLCAFSCANLPSRLKFMKPIQIIWKMIFKPSFWARLANFFARILNGRSSIFLSTYVTSHSSFKKASILMSQLEPARRVKFEGVWLNIPCKAEENLKLIYGDYLSLPPDDQRVSVHSEGGVYVDRDYKDVLRDLKR